MIGAQDQNENTVFSKKPDLKKISWKKELMLEHYLNCHCNRYCTSFCPFNVQVFFHNVEHDLTKNSTNFQMSVKCTDFEVNKTKVRKMVALIFLISKK